MVKNLEAVKARLARVPAKVKEKLEPALKREVDDLVEAMKRAAPVGSSEEGDTHPGRFRDSIHEYQNPQRELSYRVTADAKDDAGEFIGSHIEQGHRTAGGTHVPGRPSFFVTYRARRRAMRRRLTTVARNAFKDA